MSRLSILALFGLALAATSQVHAQVRTNSDDTAALPGLSWTSNTNTGLYNPAANIIGFSAGGAERARVTSAGISVTGVVRATQFIGDGSGLTNIGGDNLGNHTATTHLLMGANRVVFDNSVSDKIYLNTLATYGFGAESNTLTSWAPTTFRWRVGGTTATTGSQQMLLNATGLTVSGSVLINNDDAVTLPGFSWASDNNTGFYNAAADQIGVATGGAQRLLINSAGLLVTGRISTTGVIDAGSYIYGYVGDSASAPGYTWSGDTNTGMYNAAADQIGFTAGGTQRLRVITTGAVVTGNMTATAFLYSSDKRLKHDIKPLPSTLEQLAKIGTYTYRYKNDEKQEKRIGVIAQEVKPLFPEAVRNDEDNMMSVDYPSLVPVLIKAVNELNAQMKDARAEIKTLKASNEALKKDLQALKSVK